MSDMIAQTEKAITDYDSALLDNLDLDDAVKMIIGRLAKEKLRAKAAESRADDAEIRAKSWHDSAMTLADQRDAAYKRNTELEAERDEARSTCERMNEIIKKIATGRGDAQQERDEARRQLSEAQHAIDVLSNTIVAQDATIKRLEQAREDVEDYRIRVNELFEACRAARDWFDRNTKQGHIPGPVEKMLIDAISKSEVVAA